MSHTFFLGLGTLGVGVRGVLVVRITSGWGSTLGVALRVGCAGQRSGGCVLGENVEANRGQNQTTNGEGAESQGTTAVSAAGAASQSGGTILVLGVGAILGIRATISAAVALALAFAGRASCRERVLRDV